MACVAVSVVATAGALAAQQTAGGATTTTSAGQTEREVKPDTPSATREELGLLLEHSLKRAADPALKAGDRTQAQSEVTAIRARLERGDFQAGDRFFLTVIADSLRAREVIIRDGPAIDFGALPEMSLKGVLRSEVEGAIRQHLSRYFRSPEVRVQLLTRISVTGAVMRPGSYSVPPFVLLSDVLTQVAGGPLASANPDKIVVLRNRREFVSEKAYRSAVKEGLTLDRLGIQSGDEIRVGERARRNWVQVASISMLAVSAFTAALALIRASYSD